MKTLMRLLCFAGLLEVMVVFSTAQKNRQEGPGCSRIEVSKIVGRYLKILQAGVIDRIHYTNSDLRNWETKAPHFKRRLLMWRFIRMDSNRNGLLEYDEGATKKTKWRLPGSRHCIFAFMKECDKDNSRSVSPQEWMDCFKIPACNKKCTSGKLDEIRCQCPCTTNAIQGRVTSVMGIPLQQAKILSSLFPYTQLANTNKSGHFKVTETCISSQAYTIMKDGYLPIHIEAARLTARPPLLIQLEDAEPPHITVHPKSKVRLNGQRANFICKSEGATPIKIYWYRNGEILQNEGVARGWNLFINDVNGAQGSYSCKAVNDYGSEISNTALLTVKEQTEETCNSTPTKNVYRLSPGCTASGTNENTLDLGRCSNEPCAAAGGVRSNPFVGCGGDKECCCSPVETTEFEIRCGSVHIMNMERVTKCGCTTCTTKESLIKG